MLNIFICNFFLQYENSCFANYAGNTKIHIADKIQKKYQQIWLAIKWKRTINNVICLWYFTITHCKIKTLEEININNKLKFDNYVGIVGQKANRKLNVQKQNYYKAKLLYSITEYNNLWKIFLVKTRLAHHIAYYKRIMKSLYAFIQQTIKREHTHCRHLPLWTFTLGFDNTWSFYLSEVFLKDINATIA